jgi:Rieske Fe-S protein
MLAIVSWARGVRAQPAQGPQFSPLSRPVRVPLTELITPFRPVPFVVESKGLPGTPFDAGQPIHLRGVVLRTSAGDDAPERFRAISVVCPHEGCEVEVLTATPDLPAVATAKVTGPIYLCPCHASMFKLDDGGYIEGPAPRGLFLFRVKSVSGGSVEIAEVEEEAKESTGWWSPGGP